MSGNKLFFYKHGSKYNDLNYSKNSNFVKFLNSLIKKTFTYSKNYFALINLIYFN